MRTITPAQYAMWLLSPLPLFLIAFIMHRSGQRRSFPWFFTYLLWVAASSYVLFAIHFIPNEYLNFYSFWAKQAIAVGLSIAVIYEVCRNVLTSGTFPISKSTFLLINGVLVIIAAVASSLLPIAEKNPIVFKILILMGTARIDQVGLTLILLAISLFFGFYWSSQAFGIIAGFGIYAFIELVNTLVRAKQGPVGNVYWGWISVLSYQFAVAIWVVYAIKGRKLVEMELPEAKELPVLSR
jgi:hypothetical protein